MNPNNDAGKIGQAMAACLAPYADETHYPGHALSGGLICGLYLHTKLKGLPHDRLLTTLYDVKEHYPPLSVTCDRYGEIFRSMSGLRIDGTELTEDLLSEALDFYRESYGQ